MTNRRATRGFTLVELLVVIAIISVLMGLLLPAVQSARESGRRATCLNNQKNIALAMFRYNDSNGFLPGWRNRMIITSATIFPSWPVMSLPFLERNDIYKAWQTGTAAVATSTPYLSMFACPSTPPDSMTSPILAYAGNCGTANSVKANGVMVDTELVTSRLSLDEISDKDGTAMTVIVSEKCISGTAGLNQNYWDVRPTVSGTFTFGNPSASFVAGSGTTPGFGMVGTASAAKVINVGSLGGSTAVGQINTPSSNHPGGAVVAFCDGHIGFLKDSLAQNVYGRLLTSDGLAASGTAALDVWDVTTPPPPLSEGDFQ